MGHALIQNLSLIGNCLGTRSDLERASVDYADRRLACTVDSVFTDDDTLPFLDRTFNDRERFGKVVFRYSPEDGEKTSKMSQNSRAPRQALADSDGVPRYCFYLVALAAFFLDWVTKWWALRTLEPGLALPTSFTAPTLTLVSNTQGFRGLALPWAVPRLYALVGIIVLSGVFWIAAMTPARAHRYLTAFGLILGGGLGNVIELGVRGAATDFITMGLGAFNLADVWVTAGGMMYLWLRLRDGIRKEGWKRTIFESPPFPLIGVFLPPSLRDT